MKNAINYYYNLNPTEIHQSNKIYKFHILNSYYVLCPCNRSKEEIKEIFELHKQLLIGGYYCHQIILNINNEIETIVNGIRYILLKNYIEKANVSLNDILKVNNIYINHNIYKHIQRVDWYNMWIEKTDYIEYQISQFGKKYPLIRESSDYYIGLAENCISLLANLNLKNSIITISHNRINSQSSLFELYNPLNFILDHRIRDISEYIKFEIINKKNIYNILQSYIYNSNLNEEELELLFVRILYPSYYFDICEQIIDKKKKEAELLYIINNIDYIEQNIKIIYKYLKNMTKLPDVEWLIN